MLLPIECKSGTTVNKHDTRGFRALHATYPQAKIMPGLVIYSGPEAYKINELAYAIPWHARLR